MTQIPNSSLGLGKQGPHLPQELAPPAPPLPPPRLALHLQSGEDSKVIRASPAPSSLLLSNRSSESPTY